MNGNNHEVIHIGLHNEKSLRFIHLKSQHARGTLQCIRVFLETIIASCELTVACDPIKTDISRSKRARKGSPDLRIGDVRKAPETMTRHGIIILKVQTNSFRPCIGRARNIGKVLCNIHNQRIECPTLKAIRKEDFIGPNIGGPIGNNQRNISSDFGQLRLGCRLYTRKFVANRNQRVGALLRCLLNITARKTGNDTVCICIQRQPIIGRQLQWYTGHCVIGKGLRRTSLRNFLGIHSILGRACHRNFSRHSSTKRTRRTDPKGRIVSSHCQN